MAFKSALLLGILSLASSIAAASIITRQSRQCETDRYSAKPRIFICTDMSNEPDDQMSLVRFLTYSNEFSIQGIAGVTSTFKNDSVDEATIRLVISAYGNVTANLNANVPKFAPYPPVCELLSKVYSGHPVYGLASLDLEPSNGSLALIKAIDGATAENPQWVTMWGGASLLAEALNHVSKERDAEAVDAFVEKIRVYSISDQDDAGVWIRENYPKIFYIVSLHGFVDFSTASWNGISGEKWRKFDIGGPDSSIVTNDWLQEHIRIGPLGAHYPRWNFIMEGDTPSFFPLIQNGLGSPEHPEWGSWGGRFIPLDSSLNALTYSDTADWVQGVNGQFYMSSFSGIWRWRADYQYDFASRMQWTIKGDASQNNHAPVVVLNGTCGTSVTTVDYKLNDTIILDASCSWDPDNDPLQFNWLLYREATIGTLQGNMTWYDDLVEITPLNPSGSIVSVKPLVEIPMHLILSVRDNYNISMVSYKRVILDSGTEASLGPLLTAKGISFADAFNGDY